MLHFLIAFHLLMNDPSFASAKEVVKPDSLKQAIENIESDSKKNRGSFEPSIAKAQREIAKYKEFASKLVGLAENKQTQITTIADEKNTGVIDKWLDSYKQINAETKSSKAKEGFYIFVSFSMPKTQLENLDKVARKIGAKLVMRGLKDNSFKETIRYIKEIKQEGIIIDIDPESFAQFQINLTPAFVVSDGLKHDKVVGNLSIAYVLNKFLSEGETAALSKGYLKRLGNDA